MDTHAVLGEQDGEMKGNKERGRRGITEMKAAKYIWKANAAMEGEAKGMKKGRKEGDKEEETR